MNHQLAFLSPTVAGWADLDHDARVALVAVLTAEGLTTRGLAERVGLSRDALIGWAWRNKVQLPGQWRPAPEIPAAPEDPAVWAPLDGQAPKPFGGRRECQWPVGDVEARQCCGAPKVRGSYCADHAAVAYRPRKGDFAYSEMLRGGHVLAGVEPGLTAQEAIDLVVGRVKRREGAE